ncbi:MAG: HAMP domain-containing protein [Bacillota bacterium]
MKIRQKILISYLIIFTVFVLLTFLALNNLRLMQRSYSDLITQRAAMVSETKDLLLAVEYEALMLRTFLLTGNEEYEKEFRKQAQRVDQHLAEMAKHLTFKEERVLYTNLKRTIEGFTDVYAGTILAVRQRSDLTDQEKLAEVIRITIAKRGTVRGVIAQGEGFVAYQNMLMTEAMKANEERVKAVLAVSTSLGVFSLLLGILIALYISRTIAVPLHRMEEQVNRIARGDLTPQELDIVSRDEIGQLARSFGVMLASLHQLGGRLQAIAEEIGRFAEDLGQNVHGAVAASADTAAVLGHINEGFRNLRQRAQALAGVSDRASEQAKEVQESTARVLQQMESSARVAARASRAVRDLSAALTDVQQAVVFISEFAEQADSLARKAADELLPEGEKRGVFVDLIREIRMRAREAAQGTKEVNALITALQQHTREAVTSVDEDCRLVGEGRVAVRKAIEAFNGLVEEVRGMTMQIEETVEAGRVLAAKLEEVARASREQTSLVEGVAEASSRLDGMARELRETLRNLKL